MGHTVNSCEGNKTYSWNNFILYGIEATACLLMLESRQTDKLTTSICNPKLFFVTYKEETPAF